MNINTRILNKNDSDGLEGLIEVTESNLLQETFWIPITELSRAHFFDKSWTIFWGAFDKDKLIATAGLFFNESEYDEVRDAINYSNYKVAEVGRLMCHPDYRGKKITSSLMKELLDYADNLNLYALLATAHPLNTPSQKLFKSAGFSKVGHIVEFEKYERDILVRKI